MQCFGHDHTPEPSTGCATKKVDSRAARLYETRHGQQAVNGPCPSEQCPHTDGADERWENQRDQQQTGQKRLASKFVSCRQHRQRQRKRQAEQCRPDGDHQTVNQPADVERIAQDTQILGKEVSKRKGALRRAKPLTDRKHHRPDQERPHHRQQQREQPVATQVSNVKRPGHALSLAAQAKRIKTANVVCLGLWTPLPLSAEMRRVSALRGLSPAISVGQFHEDVQVPLHVRTAGVEVEAADRDPVVIG